MSRFSLTAVNEDGYGAASFAEAGCGRWVEIQVYPDLVWVHLNDYGAYRKHSAMWGADAVAVAGAVCDGDCPAGALADWLQEHPPVKCDHGFDPGASLRCCVV